MNEEMFKNVFIKNDDFEIIIENNNYIFVNYNQALWFRTDCTGMKIVNMCNGEKTLSEVFEQLANELGIHSDILKELCRDFLQQMIIERVIYNVEFTKAQIYPSNNEINDYPHTVWIHLTSECNMYCPFCYSQAGNKVRHTLEYEDVISFLSSIPEDKRNEIVFSGGEPFLYKNIVDLIKYIKVDLKYNKLTIITNGTIGSHKYAELANYVDVIQFSVDSSDKDIYELTRGKDNFEKLISSIKVAKECEIENRIISFTPTINNIETLKDIPQFCFNNGINGIHITKFMPVGRGKGSINNLQVPTEMFEAKLEKFTMNYMKINDEIRIKRDLYEIGIPDNKRTKYIMLSIGGDVSQKVISLGRRYSCGLGSAIISINYDGNIYVCPSLHHNEFNIGNIKDNIIDIMDRGKAFTKEFMVDNQKSDCYSCKYKYFCGGGCKAVSYAEDNLYSKNSNCDVEIRRIDLAIKNMIVW